VNYTSAKPKPQKATDPSALQKLVQRLSEQTPKHYCLIAPDGKCYIGPEPMVLAAHATAGKMFGFGEISMPPIDSGAAP
jgi:hypothetical protein